MGLKPIRSVTPKLTHNVVGLLLPGYRWASHCFEVWWELRDQRGNKEAISYCLWSCTGRQMAHCKIGMRPISVTHQSLLGSGLLAFGIFESQNLAEGNINPGILKALSWRSTSFVSWCQ